MGRDKFQPLLRTSPINLRPTKARVSRYWNDLMWSLHILTSLYPVQNNDYYKQLCTLICENVDKTNMLQSCWSLSYILNGYNANNECDENITWKRYLDIYTKQYWSFDRISGQVNNNVDYSIDDLICNCQSNIKRLVFLIDKRLI
jgi:hypothetical protein